MLNFARLDQIFDGAGDIFAAAYLVARGDGLEVEPAARFAACAASFIVEAPALQRVPDRASIARRLRDGERNPSTSAAL